MSAIWIIGILLSYLIISYQDFKDREVYLLTYAVLYLLFTIAGLTNSISINIDFVIINSCIITAVICLLVIYYLLRYQQAGFSKIKASVGWGDVLMLPAFVLSFSPVNMIFVFIISLVVALAYSLIINFRSLAIKTIPLAGIQALVLFCLMIVDALGLIKMQTDIYPLF